VLPDYMADYLAARHPALLVTVVADRFANAPNEEALELEAQDQVRVGGLEPNARVIEEVMKTRPRDSEAASASGATLLPRSKHPGTVRPSFVMRRVGIEPTT
jgi:hypothetical protein